MMEGNNLLVKIKQSFEDILNFSSFFDFENYSHCKLSILCYNINNNWVIEFVRVDFSKEPAKECLIPSMEKNAIFIQYSVKKDDLLKIISSHDEVTFITYNKLCLYFNDNFNAFTKDVIQRELKNQYPYQFNKSEVKLNFFYLHTLYSNYHVRVSKYLNENFSMEDIDEIYNGQDVFNELMGWNYGFLSESTIIFFFPIYSFILNSQIVKEKERKILKLKKELHPKLKNSIKLSYQLTNQRKKKLDQDFIMLQLNYSGIVSIFVHWYGDQILAEKGKLLYREDITVNGLKKTKKVMKIEDKEEKFIDINFSEYNLSDYNEYVDMMNTCANDASLYQLLPGLIRCLLESLLRDIFSSSLPGKFNYFHYDKYRGKIRNLGRLIELLKELKIEYESHYLFNFPDKFFKTLDNFRRRGNYNVHELHKSVEPDFPTKYKGKLGIILEKLLVLYRKVVDSKKKIDNIDENLIKKNDPLKPIKSIDKKSLENIVSLISTIRTSIESYFIEDNFSLRDISPANKKLIHEQINQLGFSVALLKIKNDAYKILVMKIS